MGPSLQNSPIKIQVIHPGITQFSHCAHCENLFQQAGLHQKMQEENVSSYPVDFLNDSARLEEWVLDLAERYCDSAQIHLIDPGTPLGLLLSFRFWIRKYPTFIVNGKKVVSGWDKHRLDTCLSQNQALSEPNPPYDNQISHP